MPMRSPWPALQAIIETRIIESAKIRHTWQDGAIVWIAIGCLLRMPGGASSIDSPLEL
jgi:hypothetical protein